MKQLLKNLLGFASVLGLTLMMAGCYSNDSGTNKNVEYVQTHKNDDVTSVNAKMYQKMGKQEKMGNIKFSETDNGLKMALDLKDVRPGTEYMIDIYEMKGCDIKKEPTKCTKVKKDLDMPMIKGDKDGKINATYMITGLTAAELDNNKIVISRKNANDDIVNVGWGILKQGMFF